MAYGTQSSSKVHVRIMEVHSFQLMQCSTS